MSPIRLSRREEFIPMNSNHLLEIQTLLRNNGILISFTGRLSQQLIEEYGEAVKTYLESEDKPKNEIFNIFSIFIEQTQNIKNYCATYSSSPESDRIAQSSIVTIGNLENGSYISSGNLVANKDLPALTTHVDNIIKMSKDELKKLYKDTLRQSMADEQAGAGVGLIDMARKATKPLEYSVTPIEGDLSFFSLKAVV
jgi:hypothetical protein